MKPQFLNQPYNWTRTPRTSQTIAELACAIEHDEPPYRWSDFAIAAIALGALLAVLMGVV